MTELNHLDAKQALGLPIDNSSMLKKLEDISKYFDLCTVNRAYRIGGVNKNYAVITDKGQFVFKILVYRSFEVFEKELVYLNRIGEYHFPIPHYLSAPDGSIAFQGRDFIAIVMPNLPGEIREPSEEVTRLVGLRLAQLHSIPTDALPRKSHWLDKNYLPKAIKAAKSILGQNEVARFIQVYESLHHFNPDRFPQSIIHGDVQPANCLFIDNKLSAIIDWEDVGIGACVLDFAWSVLSFCFVQRPIGKHVLDLNLYKHLFDGYSLIRTFTKEEINCIEDAVKYAGLTFFLWIWLQFRLYYPDKAVKDVYNYFWLLELQVRELH